MAHINNISPIVTNNATVLPNKNNSTAPSLERRCENPDCTFDKIVSKVPKLKTPQFICEPTIKDKPLLIDGLTTIFQVEGQSATLSDVTSTDVDKPLYRIVPNTHAHIVNYVVVDSDAELRKIYENDPSTMCKLLDSQKQGADQMLKQLTAGHSVILNSLSTKIAVSNTATVSAPVTVQAGIDLSPTTPPAPLSKLVAPTTRNIRMPLRPHPNLKITAVASADGLSSLGASTVAGLLHAPSKNMNPSIPNLQPISQPTMPLITPVPLAKLQQRKPFSTATTISLSTHASSPASMLLPFTPIVPTGMIMSRVSAPSPMMQVGQIIMNSTGSGINKVEKPNFDKMQQEIEELRRTVALLAEAQANNTQN